MTHLTKTLGDIRSDSRVADAFQGDAGYHVILKPGFKLDEYGGQAVHNVIAATVGHAGLWLYCITPCDCATCQRETIIKPTH